MPKLEPDILHPACLSAADRRSMLDVYEKHYGGTDAQTFQSDLNSKTHVIVLRDEIGAIQGFSTLRLFDTIAAGKPVQVIFSGDTVIDQQHWGHQTFAFSWITQAGRIKAAKPDVPLYWLLIVKGHRTYRYLSAFAIEFLPHWERASSAGTASLLHQLADEQFGQAYCRETGLVRYGETRGYLRPEFAHITEQEARRSDVAYFLERNPGYGRGDELACLTELSLDNLRPIARRQFQKGLET